MPLSIVRQNITHMQVDAIVNAANTELSMGGGVCGAIFTAAGAEAMQNACAALSPIQTGAAVITPGFSLPAHYVIHAVGPVYAQHSPERSEQLLRSAYQNALQLALDHQCRSVAFPLISSGIYGYPKEQALQVARSSIQTFLAQQDVELTVYLVVFDANNYSPNQTLLSNVASYIDQHHIDESVQLFHRIDPVFREELLDSCELFDLDEQQHVRESLKSFNPALELEQPFEVHLLHLIKTSHKTEVEVYKKANLSRKLFSKIRTGNGYVPSKRTILALAIALELDLDDTEQLLNQAGYALTRSQKFDVIIEFFISQKLYDIFQINEVLFQYEQALLGC